MTMEGQEAKVLNVFQQEEYFASTIMCLGSVMMLPLQFI